jgi:hypothetical protein
MNFNHRALVIGGERLTTPLRERYADRYRSLAQAIKAIPQFGPARREAAQLSHHFSTL